MTKFAGLAFQAFVIAVMFAGCATSRESAPETASDRPAARNEVQDVRPIRVSIEPGLRPSLGETFRYIGETYGGGGVLTAGLELRPGPAKAVGAAESSVALERLAAQYGYLAQRTPHYVFVYPAGYEELTTLSIAESVDSRFNSTRASFAVGAGTDLYNALALLSHSNKIPIIADQLVADAWCGEVFLQDAPLSSIVEALLKSARVSPSLVIIESTDRYLFVRSVSNQSAASARLNPEPLTEGERARLQKVVSIRLPDRGTEFSFQAEPETLGGLLATLSGQLGVAVTADEEVARLPVNISILEEVPLETALDLLVRQWPVPRYGYRLTSTGIHFETRPDA